MAKAKKFDLEDSVPILDDEDEETLAAIDEGVKDAAAGRTIPSEEVRKLLPQWISASSAHSFSPHGCYHPETFTSTQGVPQSNSRVLPDP